MNSSDDGVVRTPASGSVNSGLIPSRVEPVTFELVFTASLLGVQHQRDVVKNKPAGLLVVPSQKALHGILPSQCGRQMAGRSPASSLLRFLAIGG